MSVIAGKCPHSRRKIDAARTTPNGCGFCSRCLHEQASTLEIKASTYHEISNVHMPYELFHVLIRLHKYV